MDETSPVVRRLARKEVLKLLRDCRVGMSSGQLYAHAPLWVGNVVLSRALEMLERHRVVEEISKDVFVLRQPWRYRLSRCWC